jgi:hypothetical protein
LKKKSLKKLFGGAKFASHLLKLQGENENLNFIAISTPFLSTYSVILIELFRATLTTKANREGKEGGGGGGEEG